MDPRASPRGDIPNPTVTALTDLSLRVDHKNNTDSWYQVHHSELLKTCSTVLTAFL